MPVDRLSRVATLVAGHDFQYNDLANNYFISQTVIITQIPENSHIYNFYCKYVPSYLKIALLAKQP